MDWYGMVIRFLADWLIVVVVAVALVAVSRLPSKQLPKALMQAVLTIGLAFVLGRLISPLYTGERPFVMLGVTPGASYADNPGFPSDHTIVVASLTLIVWAVTKNATLALVMFGLSLAVGAGRVLAFVHTPLDILAGAACASVAAIVVYRQRLFKRT